MKKSEGCNSFTGISNEACTHNNNVLVAWSFAKLCDFYFSVDKNGDVCISILHEPGEDKYGYEKPEERWLPIHTVETIMISVISMLADPNGDSPANVDAAVSGVSWVHEVYKKINRLSIWIFFLFVETVEGGQTWRIQKRGFSLCTKEPRDCIWVMFSLGLAQYFQGKTLRVIGLSVSIILHTTNTMFLRKTFFTGFKFSINTALSPALFHLVPDSSSYLRQDHTGFCRLQ